MISCLITKGFASIYPSLLSNIKDMSFRDNLRETLDFLCMEQKDLAKKTGLSLKTIENYVKKGASVPSADKAVMIAQALGVSVEYLVTGKKDATYDRTNIQTRNKTIIATLAELNSDNYEVIVSIAKVLLTLQLRKAK